MRLRLISLIVVSALSATSALAEDRAPTAGEAAAIHAFETGITKTMDALSVGWTESATDRVEIPADVQVDGSGDGPFLFFGNMARYYNRANPDDPTAKMQALVTQMQTTTDAGKQQKLIAEIQALAATAQTGSAEPASLWITTLHNTGSFAFDGDSPEQVAAPAGVAVAFKVPAMHVTGGSGYLLEFGDGARFRRDAKMGAWRYSYVHTDGSPHIENIEIRIEGPAEVVDQLVKTYDWRQVDDALVR